MRVSLGKTADLAYGYQGSLAPGARLAPADDNTPDETVHAIAEHWVRRHPNIEKFWTTSVRQAVNAIEHPGEHFTVARIAFIREGRFLHMELPSGRRIRYPFARLYVDDAQQDFHLPRRQRRPLAVVPRHQARTRRIWRSDRGERHTSTVPRYLRRRHAAARSQRLSRGRPPAR